LAARSKLTLTDVPLTVIRIVFVPAVSAVAISVPLLESWEEIIVSVLASWVTSNEWVPKAAVLPADPVRTEGNELSAENTLNLELVPVALRSFAREFSALNFDLRSDKADTRALRDVCLFFRSVAGLLML
jgi:hypothetical protein